MVNTTSELYKRVYSEIESSGIAKRKDEGKDDRATDTRVSDTRVSDTRASGDGTQPLGEGSTRASEHDDKRPWFDKDGWKIGNKRMKRYPDETYDDIEDIDIATTDSRDNDRDRSQDRSDRREQKRDTFSIRGRDVQRKTHWLDLPTADELDHYARSNDICRSLVDLS